MLPQTDLTVLSARNRFFTKVNVQFARVIQEKTRSTTDRFFQRLQYPKVRPVSHRFHMPMGRQANYSSFSRAPLLKLVIWLSKSQMSNDRIADFVPDGFAI